MKILFLTDGFWPRIGGIETQGLQFIEGMQAKGHEYVVFSQKDHPSWKEEENYKGISIKRFDFNAIIAKRGLNVLQSVQKAMEWVREKFQPDLVHLNDCLGGSAFVSSLFAKSFRVPIVLTIHGPYLHEDTLPQTVKQIASCADRIVCVSNWVKREVEKRFPEFKDRLKLIYNGLSLPDIAPAPLPFSPPTVLLLGRLAPEKGFDTAVEAFILLKKRGSDAQMIIAGGGRERPALERLAGNLGSVRFTGILPQEQLFPTFNQATLVVVPSLLESFGLVILESMQMGRPVIASAVQGVPEVISDGETGLLVPVRNPLALCEAIQKLLAQPEMAIQMGLKGYERARRFTIGQNVIQYENVYGELIG